MNFLIYFLFILFSSRGILLYYHIMPNSIDIILNTSVKIIFISWFLVYLIINKNKMVFKGYVVGLLFVFLFSALINLSSLDQIGRFAINVFYPIAVCYYIIYIFPSKKIPHLIKLISFYLIVQIIFSTLINYEIFMRGEIIADDLFFGFFGFPRAYHFTFLCTIISFYFLNKYLAERERPDLIMFIIFASVQVLAGAGRILIIYVATVAFNIIKLMEGKKRTKIIVISLSVFLIITFNYFMKNYVLFADAINLLVNGGIKENPKIIYFIKSFLPVLNDQVAFIIGFGPGNYMSWTAMAFNPQLVDYFNNNLHGQFSTDAYQAFNNLIGFWGDIGLLGVAAYYGLIMKFGFFKTNNSKQINKVEHNTITMIITFSVLESFIFQVFDDAYFSLSFWLFIGILIKKIINSSNEVVLTNVTVAISKECP